MNSDKYVEVLQDRLLPLLNTWFPEGDIIFMQNGAPCHTSKVSMKCLEDKRISVLPWPDNSPELNSIETLLAVIKKRLQGVTIKTKTQMIGALIKAWFHDESIKETYKKLISTMPERVSKQ